MLGDQCSCTKLEYLENFSLGKKDPKMRFFLYFKKLRHWFLLETYKKLILFRVQLNRLWFGIHDKILNSLLSWILLRQQKEMKLDLLMVLWHFYNMKVIFDKFAKDHWFWTLWTLSYVDCISFSCIDSFFIDCFWSYYCLLI